MNGIPALREETLMMNHRLTASILLTLLAAPCLWATTAAANAPSHPAGYNDSGWN